jgi:hypothetical protein
MHCVALHCVVMHCAVMHCVVMHCVVMHCVVMHCVVMHCVVMHRLLRRGTRKEMELTGQTRPARFTDWRIECSAVQCSAVQYSAVHDPISSLALYRALLPCTANLIYSKKQQRCFSGSSNPIQEQIRGQAARGRAARGWSP